MTLQEKIGKDYDSGQDYRAIMKNKFVKQGDTTVLERIDTIMNSMAEPIDHNKAYYEMFVSDYDSMLAYIERSSDQQLIADIKNVFGV